MKIKLTAIILPVFLLGAFMLFGAVDAVRAEDLTPTPEVTPTETSTPTPSAIIPTESLSPEPSASATPDPTDISEPVGSVLASFASPMLLAATPVGPVWFINSEGTQSYNSISESLQAIRAVSGFAPSDGMIHIDLSYMDLPRTEDPIINLAFIKDISVFSSTALKGILGPALNPDTLQPAVTIVQPMEFMNFTGGFTVSNLCIDSNRPGESYGALTLSSMSGTQSLKNLVVTNSASDSSGIFVKTLSGSIVLENVDSSGNAGAGAVLQTGTSGTITVTNSSFDSNGGVTLSDGTTKVSGLMVDTSSSNSAVNLNGVSASGNTSTEQAGLFIKKSGILTIKNSVFNNNLGGGIKNDNSSPAVTVQGATILENVTASGNQSSDHVNGGSGIELRTNGAVTANNLFIVGNRDYGMLLDNCNFSGAACLSTLAGNVAISNSEFSENYGVSGLSVKSRGAVVLSKVNAKDNPNGAGIQIDSTAGTAAVTLNGTMAGDNTLTGNGTVLGDINHGALEILSKGNITLNYVWSGNIGSGNNNNFSGAFLKNVDGTGTITVNNSSFLKNNGSGLILQSKGTITLKNVTASNNLGSFGVDLDNYMSGAGTGNVAITGSSMFGNGSKGLNLLTKGTITISTSNASENPDGGAYLHNYSPISKTITISKSLFNGNKSVTNNGTGLEITSLGLITLTGVGASENGLGGFELLYDPMNSPRNIGGITINNSLNPTLYAFSKNQDFGLKIITSGAVSLTGIIADGTIGGYGAEIDNSTGTKSIIITASHFNQNKGGNGLFAKSRGSISLNKVSASGNTGWGASLHNDLAPSGTLPISIINDPLKLGSDLNGFNGNGDGGLDIGARGLVTITNVEVKENTGNGAFVNNFAGGSADVKITNSYFDLNKDDGVAGGYGLYVESMGAVTLNGGSANENDLYGVRIDNQRGNSFPIKPVTVNNFTFNKNKTIFGLEIKSNGVVTLTAVQANENFTFGAKVNNKFDDIAPSSAGVTVKSSTFNSNTGGIGLDVTTSGIVLLDLVTTNDNPAGTGLQISGIAIGLSTKAVTLNRVAANGNGGNGIKVDSQGLISLNGVAANGNDLAGAVMNNTTKPITLGVSVLSSLGVNNFNGNLAGDGLKITSWGAVSLATVTANSNQGGSGISIDNCVGTAPGCGQANITFTKVTTRLNENHGVLIDTNALSVTMNGLVSLSNETGSGINLTSKNELAKISLLNSLFMANGAHGIDLDRSGTNPLVLTGTSYFGNTDMNLYIH